MNRQRLSLALGLLRPEQWERFEAFASDWLAPEFPELRPVASMSGDGGQDAILWQPTPSPSVVLQYSVTVDWETKIEKTAKRIREHSDAASVLIYVTNQEIGTVATAVRAGLQEDYGLYLDIRDRAALVHAEITPGREQAATDLARDIVEPHMERALPAQEETGLSSTEAHTACVYLSLQWQDEDRDKGLTKLSFEAVVRSVLRDTDSECRASREEVHRRVRAALPAQPEAAARGYTDAALARLEKHYLRHWTKEDEFCLTRKESNRLKERLADVAADELALRSEIEKVVRRAADSLEVALPDDPSDVLARSRRVLERVLIDRGEAFASAVRQNRFDPPTEDPIMAATVRDLNQHPDDSRLRGRLVALVASAVSETLSGLARKFAHVLRGVRRRGCRAGRPRFWPVAC